MKQRANPSKSAGSTGASTSTAPRGAAPEFTGDPSQAWQLQQSMGNAGVQELVASRDEEASEESSGLENYQKLLGEKLGGALYQALADQLTLDKVAGYANDGLIGALEGLVGLLEDYEENPGDVGKFSDALSEKYAEVAGEWVKNNPQIVDAVRGWVDEHPGTVATAAVTIALLAAAAAILSDQDIPELKQTFKIGDQLTAELSAKLGSLKNIALEQITAKLNYASSNIQAGLELSSEGLDGVSGSADLTVGDETRSATLSGDFDQNGLKIYSFSALWGLDENRRIKGATSGTTAEGLGVTSVTLETVDGKDTTSRTLSYNAQTDVFSVTNAFTQDLGGGTLEGSSTIGSDHSATLSAGYEGNPTGIEGLSTSFSLESILRRSGVNSAYELSHEERVGLGLSYTKDALKAELDSSFGTSGQYSLSGKVEGDLGGGHRAGGSVALDVGDERLLDVGAFYSYTDRENFRSFLARYAYRTENNTQDMGFRVDQKLGEIYGRLEQQIVLSDQGQRYTTTASGAYFIDKDMALIGGVQYQTNDRGEDNFLPQAGVQVGGVPLVVTYDPKSKGVSVGITVPFGF